MSALLALVREGSPTGRLDTVVTTHGHWDHHRALAGMLTAALRPEVAAYVEALADEHGRRLVAGNAYDAEREVTTVAGAVPVRAPRVNDKRIDPVTGER